MSNGQNAGAAAAQAAIAQLAANQNASPMAPVGQPQAAHVGPPVGIPSGPSALELMNQIQALQASQQELVAMLMQAKANGYVPDLAAKAEPVEKIYYHQTPGSNIVVTRRGPAGEHIPEVVHFDQYGELKTADAVIQEFLDGIVDRSGVPVYSSRAPKTTPEQAAAAAQIVANAERTIDKLGAEATVKA